MAAHGYWRCTDSKSDPQEQTNRASYAISSSWKEQNHLISPREDADPTTTMCDVSNSTHPAAAPIHQHRPISPADWTFYPPERNFSEEIIDWSSHRVFVSANGYPSIEEPGNFSSPGLGAGSLDPFNYQATVLNEYPSPSLHLPPQHEPVESLPVALTHPHVINAHGQFKISQELHSTSQDEQYYMGSARPAFGMSYGQSSLYQALLSLEYTSDDSTTHSPTSHDSSTGSPSTTQTQPMTGNILEPADMEDDPEGIEGAICGVLPLDSGVESNSLPFVLQSYAIWMKINMFDPSRKTDMFKDAIVRRYVGSAQSRLRTILTANLMRAVIVLDATYKPMLAMLTDGIRQSLVQLNNSTVPVSWDSALTVFSPLHCTLELNIFFLSGPLLEALQVMSEIASVLRRVCSDPTSQYIHLPSLLDHPDSNVRGYPAIDILYSMLTGLPTQLKYDATSRRKPNVSEDAEPIGTWLIGQPSEITLVLARISSLHDEFGVDVDPCIIEEIESDIRDFKPDPGTSVDPSLTVMRLVVLEAWRQVGYINLYMRLCGESALGPRVRTAQRRLMDLIVNTKSGQRMNMHLSPSLGIAGLVATQPDERNLVLVRLQTLPHSRMDSFLNRGLQILQDVWMRTDSEGRPARWSDLRIATRRVVGI
ncbi:fungal-specific transcription factor domain protein [Rhizoctonia solani AG-3 Rhs1AP]|uniref:Fungal-specific transcription factor domain protein n=1 Tax=Rhizoctonia solani AG-3 Rhs1AP TaxID=1086054 RepID=X8J356_9AGAM|nr:fungal-specific transcription factor domain protein [Rhizoctonia solani AG-3 Rhs1AP]